MRCRRAGASQFSVLLPLVSTIDACSDVFISCGRVEYLTCPLMQTDEQVFRAPMPDTQCVCDATLCASSHEQQSDSAQPNLNTQPRPCDIGLQHSSRVQVQHELTTKAAPHIRVRSKSLCTPGVLATACCATQLFSDLATHRIKLLKQTRNAGRHIATCCLASATKRR